MERRAVQAVLPLLTQAVVLGLLNFAVGRLSLLLAVTEGVATPVFPPAGIALAALLLYGQRLAPGVFLGALLLNLWILAPEAWVTHPSLVALLTAMGIAAGSTAQAMLGTWLIRRVVGFPTPLDRDRDVAAFLLLGGPLSCLVAPSVAMACLVGGGFVDLGDTPFTWFTWWVGDTLGVLVFTTLIMIALAPPRAVWKQRQLPVGVPLVFALVATLAVFLYASNREQANLRLRFEQRAGGLDRSLRQSIDRHLDLLHSIVTFYDSSVEVTRAEFRTFVDRAFDRHPGIHALEWVPRVSADQRPGVEQAARADATRVADPAVRQALAEFRFTERSPHSRGHGPPMVPALEREEYFPVYFLEPHAGNQTALGFDLGSDPARRAALFAARDSAGPVATAPIRLVQEPEAQVSHLLILPVYDTGPPPPTVAERADHLQGFVIGAVRVGQMVDAALSPMDLRGVRLRITDDTDERRPVTLYVAPGAQPSTLAQRVESVTHHDVADRRWTITFRPTAAYLQSERNWRAWALLAGALLFTSLLGGFLLALTGRTQRVEDLVETRTADLKRLNVELERSNKDLQQFAYAASHDLQEPLRAVAGFCQILQEKYAGRLDEEADECIDFVIDGTRRMKALLADLLRYARVNTHGQPFERVDCNHVLKNALSNLHAQIKENRAKITHDTLPTLVADGVQVEQVLQNLIGNAIKYCEDPPARVHVGAKVENGEWVLSVHDNGIGIDPKHFERIFVIFQRLHTRLEHPGSGIGLAICQRIIQRHHGRMWVDSRVGGGSTFYFTLPGRSST